MVEFKKDYSGKITLVTKGLQANVSAAKADTNSMRVTIPYALTLLSDIKVGSALEWYMGNLDGELVLVAKPIQKGYR